MTIPTVLNQWLVADWTIIPICLAMAASISSIIHNLQVDWVYVSLLPVTIFGSLVTGWAISCPVDLVVLGLLPFFVVTALLVVMLRQKRLGKLEDVKVEQMLLWEKA